MRRSASLAVRVCLAVLFAMLAEACSCASDASVDASVDGGAADARLPAIDVPSSFDGGVDGPSRDADGVDAGVDGAVEASVDASPDAGVDAPPGDAGTAHVRILAINDFHGNIDQPTGSSGRIVDGNGATVNAGGGVYLAAHLRALRAEQPNSIFVSAGDLIGASPLVSRILLEEPTIEVMNALGLEWSALGVGDLARGPAELLRLQNGGCHPTLGCPDGGVFAGASFQYLAANVRTRAVPPAAFLPPYEVREIDGARIAFIGITSPGASAVAGTDVNAALSFGAGADAVDALIPELTARGIHAIVVLLHDAVASSPETRCEGLTGPIVDFTNAVDDEVDVVALGYEAARYDCAIDGKRVISAASFGRAISVIDLAIDRNGGEVIEVASRSHIVTRDLTPDPTIDALLQRYRTLADVAARRRVGSITTDIPNSGGANGQSPMGVLLANAYLALASSMDPGSAPRIALVRPGSIRAGLFYAAPGDVSYANAFAVLPFGDRVAAVDLTGAQLEALLEQQYTVNRSVVLQTTAAFGWAVSVSAPVGSRIEPTNLRLDGAPIDPAATYRVVSDVGFFNGLDGFTVAAQGTNRAVLGALTLDALIAYLEANSPVAPPATNSVVLLP